MRTRAAIWPAAVIFVSPVAVLHAEYLIRVLLPSKVLCLIGKVLEVFQVHQLEVSVDFEDVYLKGLDDVVAIARFARRRMNIWAPGVEEDPLVGLEVVVVEDDRV